MAIENILEGILGILPNEISSKIDLVIILVQALGGLLLVYLVLMIIRFFMIRKQNKIINEIRNDVRFIKNKLKDKRSN